MRWVVGTGRCGIHNYTAIHGGFVQSRSDWKEIAIKKYHGIEYDKDYVLKTLIRRKNLKLPCVADCAQFMFINEIKSIDPDAEFIWLIRDKKKCVDSFMKKSGEDCRIHPKGWEFKHSTKKQLIEWYYDEVNKIIERDINGSKYQLIKTEDLERASEESIDAIRLFA